jgi:hypothetical protein
MQVTFDNLLEATVSSVLADKKEEPKTSKIFAAGAFGGGSWPADINAYESRAAKEPKSLLKDLGIKDVLGDSDLEKCHNFLSQAISNNETMREAFETPKIQKIDVDDDEVSSCVIKSKTKELNYRLAAKYICLALIAGEKAGSFSLNTGIKFVSKNDSQHPCFYQK